MPHVRPSLRMAVGAALLALALAPAGLALAGGWAMTVLDQLPEGVVAGQEITLGFGVYQHGQWEKPLSGLRPTITARNLKTGTQLLVEARPEGKPGHYVARLTFPEPGRWRYTIHAFPPEVSLDLEVAPAPEAQSSAPSAVAAPAPAASQPPAAVSSGALLGPIGALLLSALAVVALVGGWRLARRRPAATPH